MVEIGTVTFSKVRRTKRWLKNGRFWTSRLAFPERRCLQQQATTSMQPSTLFTQIFNIVLESRATNWNSALAILLAIQHKLLPFFLSMSNLSDTIRLVEQEKENRPVWKLKPNWIDKKIQPTLLKGKMKWVTASQK